MLDPRKHYARLKIFSLLCLPAAGSLAAQDRHTGIVINVTQGESDRGREAGSAEFYSNGYRSSVDGQVLSYHSSHPDADKALLVRANREVHSITWETDTLVNPGTDPMYHLVWLAGLDRAGWGENAVAHTFRLFINGVPWFTFKNYKDSTAEHWSVAGTGGSNLSFRSQMADKFNDLFGYMFLDLPKKGFRPGAPLRLQVESEDEGSAEWYMTFEYRFNFTPRLRAEPAIIRRQNRAFQTLRLSLDNLRPGRILEIIASGEHIVKKPLNVGANIYMIPIGAVDSEETIPVQFNVDGHSVDRTDVPIQPVTKRLIYLLSYSHNDIGYSDLQTVVERKQWNNIGAALKLIGETRDYPADARYKWNLEGLFPVEGYLRQASPERRAEFIEAVRAGSLGLNALYANMLTGLANAVEMSHFTDYARRFSREYSIPITTAVESDVPGFTWGMVPALAQSGVRYFASAPNSSDRIGYALEQWGDKPFYWTSQSGDEKLLMWVAGASYASFHEGELSKLGDEKILKLTRKLDENAYPYEIFQLPYTLGDNGPPDASLSRFVKDWNERYISPKLIIATHEQMFRDFETRYGSTLPSLKGDFTPYWEDGAASTAFETALNRHSVDRLIQGEAVWSMSAPGGFPAREYDSAWRGVVLYDEHTWGASNSISEPDDSMVTGQWKIKQRFALEADTLSRRLLDKALSPLSEAPLPGRLKKPIETSFDIYNTNSWRRTDVVLLSPGQSAAGDRVFDERRRPVPSQRLSTGELAVLAESIPPLSLKRYFIGKGKGLSRGNVEVSANSLSNGLLSLTVNPHTGSIENLRWTKKQLVDSSKGLGLNEYLYVPGTNPDSARHVTKVSVKIKEHGPLFGSLLIEADAPGCDRYRAEMRLFSGISRIDIIDTLLKRGVREKEGVHIAFPFNLPEGRIRYDVANGLVRPGADQLAGSCKNFLSVQGYVDVSNDEYGVTWVTADAPMIELGSITAELPWLRSINPSPIVYSYVMNNYWHTNYKADQPGLVSFRYSILPHGEFKGEDALRFEIERRQPLVVTEADRSGRPSASLFSVYPPEVLALSVKPIEGERAWLLYLSNPSGRKQNVAVRSPRAIPIAVHASDIFGKIQGETKIPLTIAGHGSMYVRIDQK